MRRRVLSEADRTAELVADDGPRVDVAANRAARKYTSREMMARTLWAAAQPPFRWSPRPMFAWRAWLLRKFGAQVGSDVHVEPTVRIAQPWNLEIGDQAALGDAVRVYNLGRVRIGARATVSQFTHICAGTHDYLSTDMRLVKSPITIGEDAWVCADAFLGPGITVGVGAVVGARAVVFKDVAPWTVVVGNPAEPIKTRSLPSGRDRRDGIEP